MVWLKSQVDNDFQMFGQNSFQRFESYDSVDSVFKRERIPDVVRLLLIHLSTFPLDNLAQSLGEYWHDTWKSRLVLLVYSGGGIPHDEGEQFANKHFEKVGGGIHFIYDCFPKGAVPADLSEVTLFCKKNCALIVGSGEARGEFVSRLSELMKRLNTPFKKLATTLHIAFSVYLAALRIDPRTGQQLAFNVPGADQVLKRLEQPVGWRAFLPSEPWATSGRTH